MATNVISLSHPQSSSEEDLKSQFLKQAQSDIQKVGGSLLFDKIAFPAAKKLKVNTDTVIKYWRKDQTPIWCMLLVECLPDSKLRYAVGCCVSPPDIDTFWRSWIPKTEIVKISEAGVAELSKTGVTAKDLAIIDEMTKKVHTDKDKFFNVEAVKKKKTAADHIAEYNKTYAVVKLGGKTAILHQSFNPTTGRHELTFSSTKSFLEYFANAPRVPITHSRKYVTTAEAWLQSPDRRTYQRIAFEPNQTVPKNVFNLWRDFAVTPKEGDCSRYLAHVRDNICRGDKTLYQYVIAWLADGVQNPSNRPGTSLVLRGDQGTGKGVFARHYGALFGQHYRQVTQAAHLTGRFNHHLLDTLVLFADECFWAGDKQGEGTLKSLITEPTLNIEPKFQDVIQVPNRLRLIVASNKSWVIPAGFRERRFCVFDVGDSHIQDAKYFASIEHQMSHGGREALLHVLQTYDLSGIDLRNIPHTAALFDQKVESMSGVELFWYTCLDSGSIKPKQDKWPDAIPTGDLHDFYLESAGKTGKSKTRSSETVFGQELNRLCPLIQRTRPELYGKRVWHYKLPSLKACREAFSEAVKQSIPWPTGSAATKKDDFS